VAAPARAHGHRHALPRAALPRGPAAARGPRVPRARRGSARLTSRGPAAGGRGVRAPAGRGVLVTESRVHVLDNTFSQQAAGGFETDRRQLLDELAAEGASCRAPSSSSPAGRAWWRLRRLARGGDGPRARAPAVAPARVVPGGAAARGVSARAVARRPQGRARARGPAAEPVDRARGQPALPQRCHGRARARARGRGAPEPLARRDRDAVLLPGRRDLRGPGGAALPPRARHAR
jgi:hypothetical protein